MKEQHNHFYEFGSFLLNPAEHTLLHDGKVVSLTPKVFNTLLILVENKGHLVEKDELIEKVWSDTTVEEANLAKNISILRKILNKGCLEGQCIETIPKVGYRFVVPVKEKALRASELKRIARKHFAQKGEIKLSDCKVRITINLDTDVLEYFKKRAELPNSAPYQTQINTELRRIMEANDSSESLDNTAQNLLQNRRFISALIDKLKTNS